MPEEIYTSFYKHNDTDIYEPEIFCFETKEEALEELYHFREKLDEWNWTYHCTHVEYPEQGVVKVINLEDDLDEWAAEYEKDVDTVSEDERLRPEQVLKGVRRC